MNQMHANKNARTLRQICGQLNTQTKDRQNHTHTHAHTQSQTQT